MHRFIASICTFLHIKELLHNVHLAAPPLNVMDISTEMIINTIFIPTPDRRHRQTAPFRTIQRCLRKMGRYLRALFKQHTHTHKQSYIVATLCSLWLGPFRRQQTRQALEEESRWSSVGCAGFLWCCIVRVQLWSKIFSSGFIRLACVVCVHGCW